MQCWWLDAVCDEWDVALTMRGDQLAGAWPYVIEDKWSIAFRRNPRMTPYLGPWIFYPADIKDTNRDSYEHDVMEQLMSQLPEADVWTLAQYPGAKQAGLFRHYGLRIEVQQTFLLSLKPAEDVLFHQFKEPLRRNIRAAEKDITITADPSCVKELFNFQKTTLFKKRVNQLHTLAEMKELLKPCIDHNSGTLWVARQGDVVQAIIWIVWDEKTSYYLMGAKNPAVDNYRAMSLLLWHAIKEARKRGNETFDFEGSMDPGVERFFRSFCGKRELYMVLRKDWHWLWKLRRWVQFFQKKK